MTDISPVILEWWRPAAFVVGGLIIGIIVDRLLVRRLDRAVGGTRNRWDDALVESVRRAPILWATALGIYLASLTLELSPDVRSVLAKALVVIVILSITLVVARLAARLVAGGMPAGSLIQTGVKLLVFVIGIVIILQTLELPITPLLTSLGIGGLAVALALQPTLSNVFAGFQIIASRQVTNGDYVRLETGDEGYVVDVKWRNTTIKALYDDSEIVVPNSKMADAIVTNYNLPRRAVWVRVEVGVSYDSDLEKVEQVTLEVAREVAEEFSGSVRLADPVFRYRAFGDSSIEFSIRVQVGEFQRQFEVRHVLIKRLHQRFAEQGITIPFPIRTLHLSEPMRVEGIGR